MTLSKVTSPEGFKVSIDSVLIECEYRTLKFWPQLWCISAKKRVHNVFH